MCLKGEDVGAGAGHALTAARVQERGRGRGCRACTDSSACALVCTVRCAAIGGQQQGQLGR
eukprot:362534-Chlamydomonas_euryale.AAC.10